MAGRRRFMSEKAKILVMDSQTPMAMMMVSLLTKAGFEVTATHNGHKGFELATENRFDLIALEVDLPGMNGFELCGELKQRHISYQTPIIFVSRRSSIESQQRALELGAADFIEKPFEAHDFIARISACIKTEQQMNPA